MNRPNISFYSVDRPRPAETPAAAPSRVSRGVAAEQFRSALAPARAADTAAMDLTDRPAVAVPYRFGSGPRAPSPSHRDTPSARLKFSRLAQAAFDIFALGFLLFFVFVLAGSIVGAVAGLVLLML